jgi:hypothetical protein
VTLAAIPCFLLLFIGIIVVALFIFHTNRKLYNDHSKSKRPPRDRGSKLKGSPKRATIHTTTPTARFKSGGIPPTATTTTMSEGKAKGQGD